MSESSRPPTFTEYVRKAYEEETGGYYDDLTGTSELRGLQHPDEHKATALLPGDDPSKHLLAHTVKDNGFLHCPVPNLKAMLLTGELSADDERLVRAAIRQKQMQHNDVLDGGGMPGRPAPSRPELAAKPPRRSY